VQEKQKNSLYDTGTKICQLFKPFSTQMYEQQSDPFNRPNTWHITQYTLLWWGQIRKYANTYGLLTHALFKTNAPAKGNAALN